MNGTLLPYCRCGENCPYLPWLIWCLYETYVMFLCFVYLCIYVPTSNWHGFYMAGLNSNSFVFYFSLTVFLFRIFESGDTGRGEGVTTNKQIDEQIDRQKSEYFILPIIILPISVLEGGFAPKFPSRSSTEYLTTYLLVYCALYSNGIDGEG